MLAIRAAQLFDGVADQLHAHPLVLVDQGASTMSISAALTRRGAQR